jgi:hypothetical protein
VAVAVWARISEVFGFIDTTVFASNDVVADESEL